MLLRLNTNEAPDPVPTPTEYEITDQNLKKVENWK
jgi:hypothetical protein